MSTIAEITGSYAANVGTTSVTTTWGSGRTSGNTNNLLLAFTHTVFGSGAGGTQAITGWTAITPSPNNMFSGASKAAVFYKFATSGDTGSVTFTPTLVTYTVSSASGNGTTQTYITSGSGTTQPFVVGQLVTVTGLTPTGYNVSGASITAVGGSSGVWTFSVAGATSGASSGTGTATYSAVSRCSMALMEFSGVNLTTPFDQTATSVTSNGAGVTTLTPLSSSTSHVNGGAVGLVMVAANNTMGANCTYAISPYSLNNVQHFYNATVSLGIGYVNFADTTVTEVSTATVAWTTSRPSLAAYLVIRPSTYQQTGQTIAGTEVVADSTDPATTDSQTGGTIAGTEVIADSTAPTTTDSQTGASITALAADTNNGRTVLSQLVANTIAITADASGSQTSSTSPTGALASTSNASGSQTSSTSVIGSVSLVGAFSGQATGTVTATAATLLSTIELGHPTATYTQIDRKPGSVRGRAVPMGSVAGSITSASAICRAKWSTVMSDWEVKA